MEKNIPIFEMPTEWPIIVCFRFGFVSVPIVVFGASSASSAIVNGRSYKCDSFFGRALFRHEAVDANTRRRGINHGIFNGQSRYS